MKIQISTDSHVEGGLDVEAEILERVQNGLSRFSSQVTRIELHVGDENSGAKGGAKDIRCTLEARVAGRDPTVVRHDAANVDQATEGAIRKMRRVLDTALGKAGRR